MVETTDIKSINLNKNLSKYQDSIKRRYCSFIACKRVLFIEKLKKENKNSKNKMGPKPGLKEVEDGITLVRI